MRQIDIMMASRKREWEMEIHALQARLDIKDKELITSRAQIETKHKEVGQLRHSLQMSESSQQNITTQYDQQISQLRKELSGLQKDYERVQKHHSRLAATSQKHRDDKIEEASRLETDLLQAELLIKDFEEKAKAWEAQRRIYKHQVESLESQRKTLADKNQLLLQQVESYREELAKTRQANEQQDLNYKSRVVYCEAELNRVHDKLNERDSRIAALEDNLQEITSKKTTTADENIRMKTELQRRNKDVQRLEDEMTQLRIEIQSRDDLIKVSEEDTHLQNKEISQLQESLALKDNVIRTLKSQSKLQESMEFDQLANQLEEKQRENKKLHENEKTLRDEILRLQHSLDDTHRECAQLNLELASKIDELRHLEGTELKERNDTYTKLSEKCRSQEDVFQSTLEGMRKEIASLTKDLHDRDKDVAYLSTKVSTLQNKLTESSRLEDSKNQIQVENSLLRQHLNTLQHQVESAEHNLRERLSNQLQEADISIAEMKEDEERKLEILRIEHRIQLQEMKNRLSETVNRYEAQIEKLKADKESSHFNESEGRHSIKHSSSNRHKFFQNPDTSQELLSFPELITQSQSFQYERPNSRASVTSSFVAENKKHTNDLEKLLNHHITDLEKRTDETIGRYIPKPNTGTDV
ncbi:centrosomal protein of 63 kDa-like isoform X2 [Anneissia japonica]|nr:centrosomal protein of 63 kDa-like isoform X2 [Anneissia japonica]